MEYVSVSAEIRRQKLLAAVGICLPIYGFASFVATSFGYDQIAREPWFYGPAIWLNVYLLFALFSVIKPLPSRGWQTTGLVVHLVSLPSLVLSYFLLGVVIFPVVSWQWVSFYRARYAGQQSWLSRDLL